MPIPPFHPILNILPPHLGNPANSSELSPYRCTMREFYSRFSTSDDRRKILKGLHRYRNELFALKIRGFQWLARSFVEDIETIEDRSPRDVDSITFITHPSDPKSLAGLLSGAAFDFGDHRFIKSTYFVDHYLVSLGSPPTAIVELTRYWYGLFTHRRDSLWKGIVAVDLVDNSDDDAALASIGGGA